MDPWLILSLELRFLMSFREHEVCIYTIIMKCEREKEKGRKRRSSRLSIVKEFPARVFPVRARGRFESNLERERESSLKMVILRSLS